MKLNTKLLTISALFIAALMLLSPISQINTSGGGGTDNYDLDFLNSLDINNNNFVLSADSLSNSVDINDVQVVDENGTKELRYNNEEVDKKTFILVSDVAGLKQLSKLVNDDSKSFDFSGYTIKLTENLILDDPDPKPSNSIPIGKDDLHKFNGTFDGQGHTISNLQVSGAGYAGLFGRLGPSATVKNLGITNSEISVDSNGIAYSGGIAGYNDGTITNCYNTGNASADTTNSFAYSGGIAGHNGGTITKCYNTGVVIAKSTNNISIAYSGGIAGSNDGGTITNCYNTGTVTETDHSGGIAGYNGGTITNCYNTGVVIAKSTNINAASGGIVGWNFLGTIENCYNTGAVSGSGTSGGIAGNNNSTIQYCYHQDGSNTVGRGNGTTLNCKSFDEYGILSGGNKSLLDALNKWVTDNTKNPDKYRYWMDPFIKNEKYPVFTDWYGEAKRLKISLPDLNDKGVYEITDGYQLALIAANDNLNGDYVLSDDIDLLGYEWRPIGKDDSNQFNGTFDGQGHTISNLSVNINSKSGNVYSGLFGYLGSDATVKNLKMINSEISATSTNGDARSGGIAGHNGGTITNCYNTGDVKATSTADSKWVYSGGIAGENHGTITNCYNTGVVIANATATDSQAFSGGIAGRNNQGTITNCYNAGDVTAISIHNYAYSGGIVGDNTAYFSGPITNCYNIGDVTATSESSYARSGGIAGNNWGAIENCYNAGDVNATAYNTARSGGIAGYNDYETITNCYNIGDVTANSESSYAYSGGIAGYNDYETITNCYNTGTVTAYSADGDARSGGIAGYNDEGTITNCYNIGDVTADSTNGDAASGGIAGRNWGAIENCYNLGDVTGTTYSGGIAGYNNQGTIENTFYLESADDKLLGIGNTQEDNESNTKKLTSDDMKGLKLLGGDGSKYDLNKEQASKSWSPDIFGVNDDYPILADVPTQIDPNSINKPPQSAVYVTLGSEDNQAENYLKPFILTNGNEVAATVNCLNNQTEKITSHQWYTMDDKGVFIEVSETSLPETVQETYYVKVTIDGYSYTSLTRTVSDTFIVMFDSNDGSDVDSIIVSNGKSISQPEVPTKTGYDFEGWCSDETLSTLYNFEDKVSKNTTLYAKWKLIEYSVEYNGNNNTSGTVPTDNKEYTIGKTIDVELNEGNLAKSGHIFRGWNYTKDASSALSSPIILDENVIKDHIGEDNILNLYAVWTPIPEPIYTLCLNSNDSTLQTKRYSGTYGTEITLKSASDFGWNDECKFIEWNSKSDGSGISYNEGDKFSLGSEVWNLYAIWSDSSYHTVSFDSNGGNSIPSQSIQDGYRASEPTDPEKQGHSFKHWSLNGTKYDFNQSVKEDITLKAEYEVISYKVTFYYNGDVYYSTQVDYNTSLGDRMPSLPSDKDKWNTSENGKGSNFTSDSLITSDISIYAVSENSITSILIIGGSAAVILALIAAWLFMRSRYN